MSSKFEIARISIYIPTKNDSKVYVFFLAGKKYTILDMVACLLMTIGLIFFTFADQKVSPNFDPTGVILISLALCADAAIGKK